MPTNTRIEIEDMITVGTLAERLSIPVSKLITELMKNGVMATVNERIDFDTAQIIVEDLGLDISLTKKSNEKTKEFLRKKSEPSSKAISRPPVVAVMGHVDHGKTTLLDKIRSSNIAQKEAESLNHNLCDSIRHGPLHEELTTGVYRHIVLFYRRSLLSQETNNSC